MQAGYYTPSVMRDYVLAKFREAGFQRALLESDITYLQLLAGFVGYAGVLGEGDTISPNQHLAENRWEAFSKWFESVVVPAIKSIQHLWDRTSPYAICPLSTTRELTESFLSKAPMVCPMLCPTSAFL